MTAQVLQDSWIGKTVSHYRLLEKLGEGGMGAVYRAEDLVLERSVALKLLPAGEADELARRRLLLAARAASSLDHPNVCAIYEIEETPDGSLFFAMGFCDGETLRARLDRGVVEVDEALELAAQIAAGLAHAHERGVIHGDLKPANLLLTLSGQAKIVDFGTALWDGASGPTRRGSTVGTVAYMSPERLRGERVDPRTDLWSLGVVLYELLTGALPFDAATDRAYAAAVLGSEPPRVTSLRPGLPPEIEPLLARLLARDRTERYQSAGDAARDLLALRREPGKPAEHRLEEATAATTLVLGPASKPAQRALEIHPRVTDVFVGRQEELAVLRQALIAEPTEGLPATVCAIQGMPGVGKSYLADRFAVDHANHFAGGYLRVVLDPKVPATPRAMLDDLADRLKLAGGDGLAARVRERLCHPRTLLHIENVDSPAAEVEVGRFLRELPGCAVLVTGRLHDLGFALGWRQVRVTSFDEDTALLQLRGELGWTPSPDDEAGQRELVRNLGQLPLAVHLAAGHLRSGRSVTGFLRMLRQRRLAITPADRTELAVGLADESRKVLATSFSISLEILREETGPDVGRLLAGLHALGHAPLTGFGRGLGAALAGLPDDDFEELVFHAQKLCLLLPIPRQERPDGAWRLHPLLAELLASGAHGREAMERMTQWFIARLPLGASGEEADQGRRWREIGAESAALVWWLPRLPAADRRPVQQAGRWYAYYNGPYHIWSEFCEETLRDVDDSLYRGEILWTIGRVCLRLGRLARALETAWEKLRLDQERGDLAEEAITWDLMADVLQAQGDFDEAITTRQEQELPILEALGNTRYRAFALAKIGLVLKMRGSLDEALRVLREALPALEELGDVRSRAVALGFIADTLEAQGELDEALRLRQTEELPIYEMLGEARAMAVTVGKIAGILHARGEHEIALEICQEQARLIRETLGDARELALCLGRIADIRRSLGHIDEAIRARRTEQLPLLERLGSGYDLLFAQKELALLCLERGQPGDRDEAAALLHQALAAARRLRLPEAERIAVLLDEQGLATSTARC